MSLAVITPVTHIQGIMEELETHFDVAYFPDCNEEDLLALGENVDSIFTNPNKANFALNAAVLSRLPNLKTVVTASTGTVHIDKRYCQENDISVLSLTTEYSTINQISSTAELAFGLVIAGARNIVESHINACKGEWDYTNYIGRQLSELKIGSVGCGRLGSYFLKYANAFGARCYYFDPYVNSPTSGERVASLEQLFAECDVISLHTHVTSETEKFIGKEILAKAKKDVIIVNTSRGEIVNEGELAEFLKKNPLAKYCTDVFADEAEPSAGSIFLESPLIGKQIIVTQHIGGMTSDAQKIAYSAAVELLVQHGT